MEAGRPERALAIYDAEVHHAASLGVPIEMLDASALLWRLRLEDADTGGRFGPLADAWAAKSADVPWYVFNDLHAVVAAAGADRLDDARRGHRPARRLAPRRHGLERGDDRRDRPAGMSLGHRVRRGALRRRRRRAAPIRRCCTASVVRTPSATRCSAPCWIGDPRRRAAPGPRLTAERLGVRETSVYGWTQRARALRGLGDEHGAAQADAAAAAHRGRFSAA